MTEKTSHIPKFGSWDADEKRPFSQIFESARASKGGELHNEAAILRPRHSRRASRESADLQSVTDAAASQTSSPQALPKGALPKAHSGVPRHHRSPSSGYENGAGERFIMGSPLNNHHKNRSPLHPQAYQAKVVNKVGSTSPAWENKFSSNGSNTSSRSRSRASSTLPRVDKSAVLPKFGSWDAKDPSSGEFTVIFQKARDEKKSGGPVRIPQMQNEVPGHDEDVYPKQRQSSRLKSSNSALEVRMQRGWFSCFQAKGVEP